jgi:hypothetical protein
VGIQKAQVWEKKTKREEEEEAIVVVVETRKRKRTNSYFAPKAVLKLSELISLTTVDILDGKSAPVWREVSAGATLSNLDVWRMAYPAVMVIPDLVHLHKYPEDSTETVEPTELHSS